jgi:hemolysin D
MSVLADRIDPRIHDFAPSLLALQARPPSPLPRAMLLMMVALFATLLIWSHYGKLDIVAVAEGKLVPVSYLKIVQPAEGGILKDILVREGDVVQKGQVLMRMDRQLAEAETRILDDQMAQRTLQLARIDAELSDRPFSPPNPSSPVVPPTSVVPAKAGTHATVGYPPSLISQVQAQYEARRQSHETALAEERAALRRATEDLAAAEQVRQKLAALLPTYQQEERALAKLGVKHLAAELDVVERKRKRIETEQDLKTQVRQVESLRAAISQSETRLQQITSRYREQLQNERVEAQADLDKLIQERAKQQHRNTLLELKAPQAAVVKDLATHTLGTVVSPGTILLTLVPQNEPLRAEVMIRNEDIGFVKEGQTAKVKLAAYPFQKYGLVEGKVVHVSADAEDPAATQSQSEAGDSRRQAATSLRYKAVVALAAQSVDRDGMRFEISPGMQVVAEIDEGRRTVMEYLLSPVQKTISEGARER